MYSYLPSRLVLRIQQVFVVLMLTITLSACSTSVGTILSALNPLDNGGVNANVQAGKTNTQTVGTSSVDNRSLRVDVSGGEDGAQPRPEIKQDNSNITNQELPVWVWIGGLLLLIVGWVTDTPGTIWKNFRSK